MTAAQPGSDLRARTEERIDVIMRAVDKSELNIYETDDYVREICGRQLRAAARDALRELEKTSRLFDEDQFKLLMEALKG